MSARLKGVGPPIFEHLARVRRVVLLVVIAGVALLFLRVTNDPFNLPKLGLLATGVTLAAGIRVVEFIQGRRVQDLGRLLGPALMVITPLTLAWLFAAPFKDWALLGYYGRYGGLIPYLLVALLGLLVADGFSDHLHQLAWTMVGAAALVGGYALVQIVGADPYDWQLGGEVTDRAVSTIGNPNFTGGVLATALPLVIGLYATDPQRRRLVVRLGVVIAGGLIISFSQGPWAGGIAGAAIVLGWLWAERIRWAPTLAGLVAIGAAAVVVGAVILTIVFPDFEAMPQTVESRGYWWVAATRMASDFPILGRGPNGFTLGTAEYRTLDDATRFQFIYADDPHSIPLAFLAAGGVIGFLGFLGVAAWLIAKLRELADRRLDAHVILAIAFAGGAVAYLVGSLVSIDVIALRVFFWACLGGVAAGLVHAPVKSKARSRRQARESHARPSLTRPSLAVPSLIALAALSAGALWWSANVLLADARVSQGQKLFDENKPDAGAREFALAVDFRSDYRYRQMLGVFLGETGVERGLEGARFMEAMDRSLTYTQEFPDPATSRAAGLLWRNWSSTTNEFTVLERSLVHFRRALSVDPLNPLLLAEMSDVLVEAGHVDDAVALLEGGIEDLGDSDSPEIWGALALARAESGDDEGATEAMERALALDADERRALEARDLLNGPGDGS